MMKTKPGSPTTYFSGWTVATLIRLFARSGCDSNGDDNIDANGIETEFHVRYQVVGSCDLATAVGCTLNGRGGNNSITANIFVDGIERGSLTDSGTGDLHVNVGVTLN